MSIILLLSTTTATAVTWGPGDLGGADLVVADGDVLDGAITGVGLFHVPVGVTAVVAPGIPLRIEADEVWVEGTLDGDAAGHVGGSPHPPDGEGPGGGVGSNSHIIGAGGGGYGGAGGQGADARCPIVEPGLAGGLPYGTPDDPLDAPLGSGGGYNWDPGGRGGGSISLVAPLITVAASGRISVDGGAGTDNFGDGGGAGGGSGGTVVLEGDAMLLDGPVSAKGGPGGRGAAGYCPDGGGGGGGGGGRIKILGALSGDVGATAVARGAGGASDGPPRGARGERGTVWIDDRISAVPPSLTATPMAGGVEVVVTGASAWGNIAVVVGTAEAVGVGDLLIDGRCAGTDTGVIGSRSIEDRWVDGTGAFTRTGPTFAVTTGDVFVVVDLWSCQVSVPVVVP